MIIKIKNKISKYISNNKLFLSYIVLSVLVTWLLRVITIGFSFDLRPLLIDTLFILFIGTFGYLFKRENRFGYYLFWLFFISALAIGDTIYYQFYQSYLSINLISTASMIGEVNDSLWNKIHIRQFIFIIFPIIFIIINNKLKKKKYYELLEKIENNISVLKRIGYTFAIILIFLLCSLSINDVNKLSNQFNRGYIVKKYGLCLYTINDLIQSVDFNYEGSYDEAKLVYKNYYACKWEKENTPNEYSGVFRDKNIIFIHAESIQNFLIDLKINDEEVTPNINKFVREGMYFSKFYPQISVGTSSDTEFTLTTSLMPSSRGTVFINYYDRKYYSIVNYFNNLGYYTFSMHGNDRNYWNRATMHERLGYKHFYASESYDIPTDIKDKDYIGLGLSDKSFFKQSIPKLQEIKNKNTPFFGTMITLSNHSPFKEVDKYGEFDVSLTYEDVDKKGNKKTIKRDYLENTDMGNYLKSAHYADSAFGEFINELKKTNILDNTIIVFYGDHEARLSKDEFDLLYNYEYKTDTIKDESDPSYISVDKYNYDLLKNTPFVIWSNEMDLSTEITKVMGMYDILPTIANMFGFNEKYSLGHDIFSDNEGIVVFPNGNVLTDKVYYSDLYEEYISLTNEPISSDYINNISEYANTILEVSNGIVTFDLIDKEKENVGICEKK